MELLCPTKSANKNIDLYWLLELIGMGFAYKLIAIYYKNILI